MHDQVRSILSARGRALALASAAVLAAAIALPVSPSAGQADPPGNNGTVKVDGVAFDDAPDNEPHPGCTFQIDFYGFDAGVGDATVSFDLQAPTVAGRTLSVVSGDLTPDIGQDAAGGGTDLDASETYQLAFTGEPQRKQGYHVKLTVNAPGSIGADTKHKVFWVEACEAEAPTTTTTVPDTTTTLPVDTAPSGGGEVEGSGVLGSSAENGGVSAGAPVAPPAAAAPVRAQADYTG